MTVFKVDDKVKCIDDKNYFHITKGEELVVQEVQDDGKLKFKNKTYSSYNPIHFELIEDRSKWHKHHDCIVAWAKGAKIQRRDPDGHTWSPAEAPGWYLRYEYRIKPKNAEKIQELEKELQETIKRQVDLAEQLKALKEE